ncbi:hypothetical protein RRG08_010332 [Elysia crispata]|uniref:Uncharacterized protein n=1 Tax=Elysia crispata TaxID=231223 RepID=A0AAE0Y730_9GAST|nr:hypothetical protein RRG08_010332 [Elysia crispata]
MGYTLIESSMAVKDGYQLVDIPMIVKDESFIVTQTALDSHSCNPPGGAIASAYSASSDQKYVNSGFHHLNLSSFKLGLRRMRNENPSAHVQS